ncbi:MAG: UDP-N-acetylmuramoyl-tripeptide--D-alanyl-D-alanine ligase [Chlamydiota bacterium]
MNLLDCAQVVEWLIDAECDAEHLDRIRSEKIRRFQHDSRQVREGDLFFALSGEKVDGHHFLEEVAQKGAIAAVVSKEYRGPHFGLCCFAVSDIVKSLQNLARIVHEKSSTRVVAVTGSVGKTTTKEFISTLLQTSFRVAKTPGNANSQVGVPLSILNAEGNAEVFVMEMGMSQPHEIERLVQIAPPEIAVITKIALSHAEFFPDGFEGIAAAKAEILSSPHTQLAIVNRQVMQFEATARASTEKVSYCLDEDLQEGDYALKSEGNLFYVVEQGVESPRFSLPFAATHLCENFLGAVAVARRLGMQWPEIIAQAQKLKSYQKRFEVIEKNGITFINDSYNANPTSMRAALMNMPRPGLAGKSIAVLGSMKELGSFATQSHLEVGQLALKRVDYLICLGEECLPMVDLFRSEGRPVDFYLEIADVKQRLLQLAKEGDVVLLKGSNSKQLWRVLE